MDFKGITWVGNVYQKFEAMCLEVEEIIVQDTVKYVENQVHTVGASMKRFYSDVVQDLIPPPSSRDPVKVTTSSMPNEGMPVPVCPFDKLDEDAHEVIKGSYVTTYEKKGNHGGTYRKKSKLGAKRISRKDNCPPVIPPGDESRAIKNLKRASPLQCPGQDLEQSCNPTTTTENLASIAATRFSSTQETSEGNNHSSDSFPKFLADTSTHDTDPLIESVGCTERDVKQSCSECTESNAPDNGTSHETGSQEVPTMKSDTEHDEYVGNNVSTSDLEQLDEETTDTREMASVVEHGKETVIELSQKSMEESCIFVNPNELDLILNKDGNPKPYKKKIRDAFSSRMKSTTRKQEYRRLAAQWTGKVNKSNQLSTKCLPARSHTDENVETSHVHDPSESDWELL